MKSKSVSKQNLSVKLAFTEMVAEIFLYLSYNRLLEFGNETCIFCKILTDNKLKNYYRKTAFSLICLIFTSHEKGAAKNIIADCRYNSGRA